MKSTKKLLSVLMALVLCILSLAGCSGAPASSPASPTDSTPTAGEVEISFPTFMCGTASQTEWSAWLRLMRSMPVSIRS